MTPIEPPDSFHVSAAQGWMELGSPAEAQVELDKVAAEFQTHPEVMALRWEILSVGRNWEAALEVAAGMIHTAPHDPVGWFNRSYCLHELKRTDEARDNLLRVVDKFPLSGTMRYNLACYECQLGHLDQARSWLRKAFDLGDPAEMKSQALRDPDLRPLWPEIQSL
jgi:tetratricopeptide (TPR) repeat protein